MITLSQDKPAFANYQASRHYLDTVAPGADCSYLDLHDEGVSIPLIRMPLDDGGFDLVTPINFQPALSDGFWPQSMDAVSERLAETGAVCCYIQGRNDLGTTRFGELIDAGGFRTNYYFELHHELDGLLARQARDCRQRLNKALRSLDYQLVNESPLNGFVENYRRIAHKNAFSRHYRFDKADFIRLRHDPGIEYLEIQSGGDFHAGGFFAVFGHEVDYLFGADSLHHPDTIRLLIWEAVKHFKRQGRKRLYLGGGISEGDSLASFKQRFGTEQQRCSSIRMVLDRPRAEVYMGEPFSTDWFAGWFPPYHQRRLAVRDAG